MGQNSSKESTEESRSVDKNLQIMEVLVPAPGNSPTSPTLVQNRKDKLKQLANQMEAQSKIPANPKAKEHVDKIIVIINNLVEPLAVSNVYDDPVDLVYPNRIKVTLELLNDLKKLSEVSVELSMITQELKLIMDLDLDTSSKKELLNE